MSNPSNPAQQFLRDVIKDLTVTAISDGVWSRLRQLMEKQPDDVKLFPHYFNGMRVLATKYNYEKQALQPAMEYMKTLSNAERGALLTKAFQAAGDDPEKVVFEFIFLVLEHRRLAR